MTLPLVITPKSKEEIKKLKQACGKFSDNTQDWLETDDELSLESAMQEIESIIRKARERA